MSGTFFVSTASPTSTTCPPALRCSSWSSEDMKAASRPRPARAATPSALRLTYSPTMLRGCRDDMLLPGLDGALVTHIAQISATIRIAPITS
jgi:hypothetical protein